MRRLILPLLLFTLMIQACSAPGSTATANGPVTPATVTLTVYFTDMPRYEAGSEPYETGVKRTVPNPASLPEAVHRYGR